MKATESGWTVNPGTAQINTERPVLVTGATGFVGGRLVRALSERKIKSRCIVRSMAKFRTVCSDRIIVDPMEADLLVPETLARALEGVGTAFYLVHSMGGRSILENRKFARQDRLAAGNFLRVAEKAGVERIIYLGGLGEMGENLSKHLASRQEVGRIIQSGRVQTIILRAANVIGAGGAPFEMLRYLVERLPVIIGPRWINTRCQPIDVNDAVAYLIGCMGLSETESSEFDIGGPEIVTYREMMETYARVRGLKRVIVSVPFLTPRLSSLSISILTPVPSGVTNPLLEGLRNEVICRENRIRELVPLRLTPLEVSICNALQEVRGGPGKLFSRQSCFLRGQY